MKKPKKSQLSDASTNICKQCGIPIHIRQGHSPSRWCVECLFTPQYIEKADLKQKNKA